jgi:hypothetical protein
MNIAVWLESPYSSCWTITPAQIEYMKSRIPGAQVQHARSPDEFVELLPQAETAISWFFKQEWVDRAPLLRYLVTPAAGLDCCPRAGVSPKAPSECVAKSGRE